MAIHMELVAATGMVVGLLPVNHTARRFSIGVMVSPSVALPSRFSRLANLNV
jgi:hypothetical protein